LRYGTADRATVEVGLEHVDGCLLDRDPSILTALAADMDDRTIIGTPDVADVGAQ
jgi:hypothetical protein